MLLVSIEILDSYLNGLGWAHKRGLLLSPLTDLVKLCYYTFTCCWPSELITADRFLPLENPA